MELFASMVYSFRTNLYKFISIKGILFILILELLILLSNVFYPILFSNATNQIMAGIQLDNRVVLLILIILISSKTMSLVKSRFYSNFYVSTVAKLKKHLFELFLVSNCKEKITYGNFIQIINNHVNDSVNFLIRNNVSLVISMAGTVLFSILLVSVNAHLLFFVLLFPVIHIVNSKLLSNIREMQKQYFDEREKYLNKINTYIQSVDDIKINYDHKVVLNKFSKNLDKVLNVFRELEQKVITVTSITSFFTSIVFIIFIYICYNMTNKGELQIRDFVQAIFYYNLLSSSIQNNFAYFQSVNQNIISIIKIEEFINSNTSAKKKTCKQDETEGVNLLICNLNYAYEKNKNVLVDFNLLIDNCGVFVLVGENGVGKSTLLQLISGTLLADKGIVKLNGYETWEYSFGTYLSTCNEKNKLYDISLVENLASKMQSYNDNDVLSVFDELNIPRSVISRNIEKNDFSSGEKNKLFLARALITKSKVILLDEPSNYLDELSKEHFLNVLKKYRNQAVFLIATHDTDIIEIADSVVAL